MFERLRLVFAVLALTAAAPAAHAAQVCAWLEEKLGEDDYHEVTLWVEADTDLDFYYMIKGEGLVGEGMKSHSPGSGTYSVDAHKPAHPWGFGATLSPPGKIDIAAELHAPPKDVFADTEPPLLAAFTFHRDVPEGETAAPKKLAQHQCRTVTPPPRD